MIQKDWSSITPYVVPPVAASAAIIPVFYGFIAKSAQQTGNPIPKMLVMSVFKEGFKAAPTIGVIVGTQMIAQNAVEKALKKNKTGQEKESFMTMLASSIIVGGVSAPTLAVFNGQTMGRSIQASLKELSPKQTMAIVTRETSFLFSLRISDPVGNAMKKVGGDNKAVEYFSAFVSGAIGSIVGHPADTALTRWQKGMKIENFRQLMAGAPMKAVAVGGFAMIYKLVKEILQKK